MNRHEPRIDAAVVLGGGGLLLCAFALANRLPGLAPTSLYMDDVWVAALTKLARFRDVVALRPPHGIGFLWLVRSAHALFGGGDVSLQLVPFVAGLLQVPLAVRVGWQLTKSAGTALLFGALVAASPGLAGGALRVKPYATDALLTLVLLSLAASVVATPRLASVARLAAVSVVGCLVSFPGAMTGGLLTAFGFFLWWRSAAPSDRLRGVPLAVLTVAAFGVVYLLLLRGLANEAMVNFWAPGYVPLESAGNTLRFLANRAGGMTVGAFPIHALALLCPVGVLIALARAELRWLGAFAAGLAAALLCASALKLYPIGDPRTATFLVPLLVLLVVLVPWGLATLAVAPVARRAWNVLACGLAVVSCLTARAAVYPATADRLVVERLEAVAAPADGILVYPHANWSVGYYTHWPVQFRRTTEYATRFEVTIASARAMTLPGLAGYEDHPEVLDPWLEQSAGRGFARILYVATHLEYKCCRAHAHIRKYLEQAGYRVTGAVETSSAQMLVLDRAAAP